MNSSPHIIVLGAGPIGLETALYARSLGLPVTVFEAGRVAEHLRRWGHVRLFTPWPLNVSELGMRRLRETGQAPDVSATETPTAADLAEQYLIPLSGLPELEGVIREGTRVVAVGRDGLLKGDEIGTGARGERRFRVLVERDGEESVVEGDVVIDATGVYGQPNQLGHGGIPCPGERSLGDRQFTGIPDVHGSHRREFEGRRVLVVGGGLSAATTLCDLAEVPGTELYWVTRAGYPPLRAVPDDPLPTRAALIARANQLVETGRVKHFPQSVVSRLEAGTEGVPVQLLGPGEPIAINVDRVVTQTGFHPDNRLYRELQVHECYASQGPMALSAALLGTEGGDCMSQVGFGPKSLEHPEPGFYIIGHKSYGRSPEFLLRIGREQVRDVFRMVTGNDTLDLYADENARV